VSEIERDSKISEVKNRTKASEHAWFNGAIGPRELGAPSVASINFHLGTSVFDGMMAYWNDDHYYVHYGEEHLIRFREGAARMGLDIPWTEQELLAGVHELLSSEPAGTQYVRPIAYRSIPELWITGSEGLPVDVCIFTVRTPRDCDVPMSCHISPVERVSSRAIPRHTKVSGAYVNSFNARKTAESFGYADGVMLDREGRIAEASAANFFAISGNQLWTPPLNPDVFPGVTRSVVIDLAHKLGIDCTEQDMRASDVQRWDGAFLCSTLMEIRPLSKIDHHAMDTHGLPLYKAVVDAFRQLTHQ
jgi:branched-chain amino acid aminotransferase